MATVAELERTNLHGKALCEEIARVQGGKENVLLTFSGGKDSLCAWLGIREHFDRVIPFYLYMVPGLSFVEQWLDRCEGFMGEHVVRLPHQHMYKMLTENIFQPPERMRLNAACEWPEYDFEDIRRVLCEDYELPEETYYATGIRAADSPMRLVSIIKHGPITHRAHKFHPVWNWPKARLVRELRKNSIPLPIDYKLFSRTWDGIDLRFIWKVRQYYPEDFRKILDWFPLAELEFARYEHYLRRKRVDDLRRRNATEAEIHAQVMQMKNDFPIKYEDYA